MADNSISPIPASLNVNFTALYSAVNAIINAIATEVVTANASAAGAVTIGNGFVTGIFGATTLVTSGLRGGNASTSNTLNVQANLTINSSSYFTLGDTVANSVQVTANLFSGAFVSPLQIGNNTFIYDLFKETSGATAQVVDSFLMATYKTAEYFISVSDNNSNSFMLTKILVLTNNGSVYSTQYGDLVSNASMGVFTANANSTAVTLYFTPVSSSTNVQITRTSQV